MVEGSFISGLGEADATAGAFFGKLGIPGGDEFLIALGVARGDGEAVLLARLDAFEFEVAFPIAGKVGVIVNLECEDIMTEASEALEAVFKTIWVKKIGDQEDHAFFPMAGLKLAHAGVEIGIGSPSWRGLEVAKKGHGLGLATGRFLDRGELFGHAVNDEAVEAMEGKVAESGGELLRGEKLAGHGRAEVEQEVKGGIFLDLKELDNELVEASVDAPIDCPVVVTEVVFGVVGKGDARAFAVGFAVGLEGPTEHTASEKNEVFQATDEVGGG